MRKILLLLTMFSFASIGQLHAQSYCSPSYNSTCCMGFSNVKVGNINNNSNFGNGYENYTGSLPAQTFNSGGQITVEYTSNSYVMHILMWVDFNRDGDFTDVGELVSQQNNQSPGTYSVTFTVPNNAAAGATRLRLSSQYDFYAPVTNPCGGFWYGDVEDYALNILPQPPFDAQLTSSTADVIGQSGYFEIPLGQNPSYEYGVSVTNGGFDTITGVTINATISNSAYTQSVGAGSLLPAGDSTVTSFNNFTPTNPGVYNFEAVASINESDTVPTNDTIRTQFVVSDTVLSRDDSSMIGRIGNGTPIEFGQTFEITTPDTLSSISFFLDGAALGTSVKAYLYSFSSTALNGNPGPAVRLDSTRTFTTDTVQSAWYSMEMGCGGTFLNPGKYFIGLAQLNPNNMLLGYTNFKLGTDTFMYLNNLIDTIGYRDAYHPTLNPLLQDITLLLRTNFGRTAEKDLLADSAYYCVNGTVGLKPAGTWATFNWGNGAAVDSINIGASGVYSVSVTDEIGCSFQDSITVASRQPIQYSSSVTNANCGASDGQVVAVGSGSAAPYSYAWSTGAMTDTLSGVAGGIYNVTITDAYGCESAGSATVLGKNPIISGAYTPPTCNGDADGSATVSIIEGLPSYVYSWQGGASTTDQLTGLAAGSYTVTVTDSSNCFTAITIDVVNPDSLMLSTANSNNPSVCGANDGVAKVAATGGVAPYSYFWSNGQNQKNAINLGTGTFDVTVTDALGCVRTSSVSLMDANAPTLATNGSAVDCSEDLGSVSVSVTGGTAPYMYSWNNGSTDSSQSAVGVGTYNVNVVDAAGCIKVAEAVVTGPDEMDVDFNVTYGPAGNGDTEIDAVISGANTPYANYQWKKVRGIFADTIAGATMATLSNAVDGDYMIIVEDAKGCLDSADVSVTNLSIGINEIINNPGFVLYPNPATDKVFINVSEINAKDFDLKLIDNAGRTVIQRSITSNQVNEIEIDLGNQATGIYHIELNTGETVLHSKVQITR